MKSETRSTSKPASMTRRLVWKLPQGDRYHLLLALAASSSISEPSLATPTLENDMISAYKPSSCHYHVESRGCSYWRRYNRLGGDVREELHQNSPTSLTQILAKINSYLKNNAFVDYKNDWS
ncbi:Uncharacterized protein HZ326_28865 [Fusarium oxysporum f. sp. albedinis]|nr:Uncharacterized protein HZ326_28865 [Fusarium oxysporum f. sp. albedinis]